MQGRSRHFGDVLAADGEVDLDAELNLTAGLVRQSQQCVRDALFDLLIGQLDHPGLGVVKTVADGLQCAAGKARKPANKALP